MLEALSRPMSDSLSPSNVAQARLIWTRRAAALDRKLLIDVTEQSVIRLLPPLIITDKEAQQITHTVIDLVPNFLDNSGATRRG